MTRVSGLVLAMQSSGGGASAAMLRDGAVLAQGRIGPGHGLAGALPAMLAGLLGRAGPPELVAVIVGPGSFTGLRAGLSVAHGIALGCGVPVVGVTVAEALGEALRPALDGRALWTAVTARRGRVFIHRDAFEAFATDALPAATGRVAVCGDAANLVAASLAARGTDVMLSAFREPCPEHVANVGWRRACGDLPTLDVVPLYVDAPEARRAAGRAAPVGVEAE